MTDRLHTPGCQDGTALRLPLFSLIRDPDVRAAFFRADRDAGSPTLVTINPNAPVLTGGELVDA